MPTHIVSIPLAAPASGVWAVLADFGDLSWIPPVQDVEVTGDGPGMTRRITGTGPEPVLERLIEIDEESRTLRYSIDENNPIPVTRYEAVNSVAEAEDGCTVTWTADYDIAEGGDDETVTGTIELIYGAMAGWLADAGAAR